MSPNGNCSLNRLYPHVMDHRATRLPFVRASGLLLGVGLLVTCSQAASPTAQTESQSNHTTAPVVVRTPRESTGAIQQAGKLVVSLDARDPSAGAQVWTNNGTMGNFRRLGGPKRATAGGQPAVEFNGTSDAYRSEEATPATLTGAHARSIEVWVYNPALDSTEECLVAWGHRGTSLANMALNYGSSGGFSAVTHYDEDLGWGDESPAAGQWHHLAYTYDGKTARIYADGVERGSGEFELVTAAGTRMNLGVENSAEGEPLFQSEFDNNWPLSLSGFIALVRVHSGSLTPEQVKANFDVEKARFGSSSQ